MKPYSTYQALNGEPLTERDKREVGSKFWNEGKWENFVLPHIKEREGILVDMGCNAGLFLKLAEDLGFMAIGVDSDPDAVKRGIAWRDKNGGKYTLLQYGIENCIDTLPVADYTVLANAHYYFTVNDWLEYVDKLQYKTRYVIIVTDEKRHMNKCWASADVEDVRSVFKNWDEVGHIGVLSQDDPSPRKLQSLCFKSRFIERVPFEQIANPDSARESFYVELDAGVRYQDTQYYTFLKDYRKDWDEWRLHDWVIERIENYKSIKENGLRKPIIIDKNNMILDGNHRYAVMRALGYKTIFVRKI